MTKVMLVNPPWYPKCPLDRVRKKNVRVPNPGLLKIAESLLQNDIKVDYVELGMREDINIKKEMVDTIKNKKPDIVGVTGGACEYDGAVEVINNVKAIDNSIMTIGGGIHFTLNHKDILESGDGKFFDIIVRKEGEITILNLVDAFEGKKELKNIDGITYREGKRIKVNKDIPEMLKPKVLEKVWKILNYSNYYFEGRKGFGIAINTMHGCNQKCSFCSEPLRWNGISLMNAEDIVKQIMILKEKVKPEYVFFADSNFNISTDRIMKFIKLMKEYDLFMPFKSENRLDKIFEQRRLLPNLRDVGAALIFCGGERTTNAGLNFFNKNQSSSIMLKAARAIQDAEIGLMMTFIFGVVDDNIKNMKQMVKQIQYINPELPAFCAYTPFPGLPEREKIKKYIRVNDLRYYTMNNAICDTKFVSFNDIQSFIDDAWLSFYAKHENYEKFANHSNPETRKMGISWYKGLKQEPKFKENFELSL